MNGAQSQSRRLGRVKPFRGMELPFGRGFRCSLHFVGLTGVVYYPRNGLLGTDG